VDQCPLLKDVNLSNNAIGDEGMTEIAKVLPVNTSLSSLNLSRCGFSVCNQDVRHASTHAHEFSPSLQNRKVLINSDCIGAGNRNNIGAPGADRLAAVLRDCSRLTNLQLQKNRMGSESLITLAEALSHCPQLANVDLSDNGVPVHAIRLACELHTCANNAKLRLEHVSVDQLRRTSCCSPSPLLRRSLHI
jgi:Ran GTPase-activating protein (RanGAP) involved in mRNA processing and transport